MQVLHIPQYVICILDEFIGSVSVTLPLESGCLLWCSVVHLGGIHSHDWSVQKPPQLIFLQVDVCGRPEWSVTSEVWLSGMWYHFFSLSVIRIFCPHLALCVEYSLDSFIYLGITLHLIAARCAHWVTLLSHRKKVQFLAGAGSCPGCTPPLTAEISSNMRPQQLWKAEQ